MSLIVNRIFTEKFVTNCFCGDAHVAGTINPRPLGDRSNAFAAVVNFANGSQGRPPVGGPVFGDAASSNLLLMISR